MICVTCVYMLPVKLEFFLSVNVWAIQAMLSSDFLYEAVSVGCCWILLYFCLRTDQSTLVNYFRMYYLLYRFTCITILFRQHRSVHMYISHAILKRLPDHLTSEIHLFKAFSLCSRHDIYWWRKNSANRLSYIQYGLKTFKLVIDFHDVDVQIWFTHMANSWIWSSRSWSSIYLRNLNIWTQGLQTSKEHNGDTLESCCDMF